MPTKLLVTHDGDLQKKYGGGYGAIRAAINRLIAADAARGVTTLYVALDDPAFGHWRAKSGHETSFKDAVDHAYALHRKPDYITIVGGPDIVPHQSLANPITGDDADDDPEVPSDLPYACDAPASKTVGNFLGPSRVVGRIPDHVAGNDSGRLVHLIDAAAKWKPRKKASNPFFGLSANVWKVSTTMSLKALFGTSATPHLSPIEGPAWANADLSPVWHFINCHGAPADPQFYGQRGHSYPVAHRSPLLAGKITRGTVVSAECCYGAELYDIGLASDPGIAVSYLDAGAIGFMGSTTIAYGPANSNGAADLLCRYFLETVRKGASTGSALLQARQMFVKTAAPLSPIDLKTLAQFLLLGDPVLTAVGGEAKAMTSKGMATRTLRRRSLESDATLITRGLDSAESAPSGMSPKNVRDRLEAEAVAAGYVVSGDARTYRITPGVDVGARGLMVGKSRFARSKPADVKFHVMAAQPAGEPSQPKTMRSGETAVPRRMLLLGREVAGRLVRIERLYAHEAERVHGRVRRHRGAETSFARIEKRARGGRA